jgi:hypothetical protein
LKKILISDSINIIKNLEEPFKPHNKLSLQPSEPTLSNPEDLVLKIPLQESKIQSLNLFWHQLTLSLKCLIKCKNMNNTLHIITMNKLSKTIKEPKSKSMFKDLLDPKMTLNIKVTLEVLSQFKNNSMPHKTLAAPKESNPILIKPLPFWLSMNLLKDTNDKGKEIGIFILFLYLEIYIFFFFFDLISFFF